MVKATIAPDHASRRCWDVIVVGAGPAGAIAARQLALAGHQVLVLDRNRFPRWKVCGCCLNQQALAVLHHIGLPRLPSQLQAVILRDIRLQLTRRNLVLPLPAGVALSRERLDAALVESAVRAGAEFLPETQATVQDAHEQVRRVRLQHKGRTSETCGRIVLAADGLGHSCQPSHSRLSSKAEPDARIGAGTTVGKFSCFYQPGTIFMAIGKQGYVGLVRLENGRLNIGAAFDPAFIRQSGGLGPAATSILNEVGFPQLPSLSTARWRGTVRLTRRARQLADHRLFLLGDAAGYVEPFTGEGITWAFQSAVAVVPLAVRAISHWTADLPDEWMREHSRLIHGRQQFCRALTKGLRHPVLVRAALGFLSWFPAAATPLIPGRAAVAQQPGTGRFPESDEIAADDHL